MLAQCIKENEFLRKIDLEGTKIPLLILRHHILPALRQNYFLREFNTSSKQQDILKKELNDNMIIEEQIISNLKVDNPL
jgi:hypothetical protein